jgi:hypothetical protein
VVVLSLGIDHPVYEESEIVGSQTRHVDIKTEKKGF